MKVPLSRDEKRECEVCASVLVKRSCVREEQLRCNVAVLSFKLLRCNDINYNNPLQNPRNILADIKRLFAGNAGTCVANGDNPILSAMR